MPRPPQIRRESAEEKDAVALAVKAGGIAIKLEIKGQRGFPDRTFLFPGAFVMFIEMKRKAKGSKPSPQQVKWIAKLRSMGFVAEVCYTAAEVEALIPWL